MRTRSKVGIYKPRVLLPIDLSTIEPTVVQEAFQSPLWKTTMQEEYDALITNGKWSLVPQPSNKKIVGCKWIFKLKRHPNSFISHYKARLVAKGYYQRSSFDFTKTFNLVIKPSTVRVVLIVVFAQNREIFQLDVNNAFLNGILRETVLIEQLRGFEKSIIFVPLVCKLHKALLD